LKLRNKILFYFSSTVIILTALTLIAIFWISSAFREESFQQQQYQKIKYTITLLKEHQEQAEQLSMLLDEQDIRDFYDEKLYIYDSNKSQIFESVDSLEIYKINSILNQLSPSLRWVETKENKYDIVGVYYETKGKAYYAISKAYDAAGYANTAFLGKILIIIFIAMVLIVLLLSLYLSNIIAQPILRLTKGINEFEPNQDALQVIDFKSTTYELQELKDKFNELLQRAHEYMSFQKNTIHHISHELKTPIAILVSELERLKKEDNINVLQSRAEQLSKKAASLGDIISALLQISKLESGQQIHQETFRVDELLFDIIAELNIVNPDFNFDIRYIPEQFDESLLELHANKMLIKQAFQNLLINAIQYADNESATVLIDARQKQSLHICISNSGHTISTSEQQYIFDYFFRGQNSQHISGFGLGLVFTQKIFQIHKAEISYRSEAPGMNYFEISFPITLS